MHIDAASNSNKLFERTFKWNWDSCEIFNFAISIFSLQFLWYTTLKPKQLEHSSKVHQSYQGIDVKSAGRFLKQKKAWRIINHWVTMKIAELSSIPVSSIPTFKILQFGNHNMVDLSMNKDNNMLIPFQTSYCFV